MSNRRKIPKQPVRALARLRGLRIPGGCDDCHAYQEVVEVDGGYSRIQVSHDGWCPWLNGVTR